ncbi:hypothetical protein MMC21_004843 [Puttea exsequens]|nr:hypothetical protein [Puttea exsequens]
MDTLGLLDKLPRELRDPIYFYIFKQKYSMGIFPNEQISPAICEFKILGQHPRLLLASKAIREEASNTLYTTSSFVFYLRFCRDYEDNKRVLRSVHIDKLWNIKISFNLFAHPFALINDFNRCLLGVPLSILKQHAVSYSMVVIDIKNHSFPTEQLVQELLPLLEVTECLMVTLRLTTEVTAGLLVVKGETFGHRNVWLVEDFCTELWRFLAEKLRSLEP